MSLNNQYQKIINYCNKSNVAIKINEPMKRHTTFGIGGNADILVFPKTIDNLKFILEHVQKNRLPYQFIGSGSNILVSDNGIKGIVITLKKSFKEIKFLKSKIYAESGVMLGNFVKQLIKNDICGYESLIGVPGTLGGALFMNAGAYGSEISNNLISVRTITHNGKIKEYQHSDLKFSYRKSSFPYNELIVDAYFKALKGNKQKILDRKTYSSNQRKEKQPLKFRSAGSIFKNPKNTHPAGYLIERAGLKGLKSGNAEISTKHANFIINHGEAKSDDVLCLIIIIKENIFKKYKINLKLEIKTLGFND